MTKVSTPKQKDPQFLAIRNELTRCSDQIKTALPRHLNVDRMIRIALTEVRKIPKLKECNPLSFAGAVIVCSQLGLEPGNALGHVYLIPFKGNVQVILGYRGMIELARRSGQIVSICAHMVCEHDEFSFAYGLHEALHHKPKMDGERGEVIAAYAIAHLVGGGHQIEVMSRHEIDAVRTRSKSANEGPWVTDYSEMARKTVLRRLFKYLPVSIEMATVNQLEHEAEEGTQDNTRVFDGELVDEFVDTETGEIPTKSEPLKEQAEQLAEKLK